MIITRIPPVSMSSEKPLTSTGGEEPVKGGLAWQLSRLWLLRIVSPSVLHHKSLAEQRSGWEVGAQRLEGAALFSGMQ